MPATVLAGCLDDVVWVKVEERGTFQNSGGLKDYCRNMIHRGFRKFVVDLANCQLMDSTFMGTLAGIALRLRELGQGELMVINANSRSQSLLENLGLDQIFEVKAVGDPAAPRLPLSGPTAPQADLSAPAEHEAVLSAHEALVEADARNAVKFHDVLEFLKKQADLES